MKSKLKHKRTFTLNRGLYASIGTHLLKQLHKHPRRALLTLRSIKLNKYSQKSKLKLSHYKIMNPEIEAYKLY